MRHHDKCIARNRNVCNQKASTEQQEVSLILDINMSDNFIRLRWSYLEIFNERKYSLKKNP